MNRPTISPPSAAVGGPNALVTHNHGESGSSGGTKPKPRRSMRTTRKPIGGGRRWGGEWGGVGGGEVTSWLMVGPAPGRLWIVIGLDDSGDGALLPAQRRVTVRHAG